MKRRRIIFLVLILSLEFFQFSDAKTSKYESLKWTCIIFEKTKDSPHAFEYSQGKLLRREYAKRFESEGNPLGETWTPLPDQYTIRTALKPSSKKVKAVEFYSATKKQTDIFALHNGKGADPDNEDMSGCPYEVTRSQWGNSGYCYNSAEKCKGETH